MALLVWQQKIEARWAERQALAGLANAVPTSLVRVGTALAIISIGGRNRLEPRAWCPSPAAKIRRFCKKKWLFFLTNS